MTSDTKKITLLTILSIAILSRLFLNLPKVFAIGTIHDITNTSNFNIRIDGATDSDQLGYNGASMDKKAYHDINNDGKLDLIIGATVTDYNSKNDSGSVYIISGDILDNYSGTGNTIDLSDSSNYNLRIDGNVASGSLMASAGVVFGDINNDGEDDMIISGSYADSIRGNVFVLYSDIFTNFLNSTGNTLDLATSSNYNLLLQGANTGDSFGNLSLTIADIDNDEKNDIILEAHHADYNSRAESGSVYIFFNTLLDDFTGTGNLLNVGTTSNFSVRIDGAVAGDTLGGGSTHVEDYNADGKLDLFLGSDLTDFNSRTDSGSIWIIDNSKIETLAGTSGNIMNMETTSNWVVRMDGVSAGDRITYANSLDVKDITRDGAVDIIVGSYNADNNTRSNSGSLWVIDNEVFGAQTGSGNVIDLSSNFLYRIDGAAANDNFTFAALAVVDINSNGKLDIVTAARLADTNGADSGSVYVFFDSLIDTWTTAGTTIDISDTNNFSLRYDGAAGHSLFFQNGGFGDFNGDSQEDLILNARGADYNSRNNSGSYFLTYNFPHTFSIPGSVSLGQTTQTISGAVNALSSITTIAAVEYSVDSNSPSGTWTACSATDGNFSSVTENFTCDINLGSLETHKVYIRATDSDGYYTSQANYGVITYYTNVPSTSSGNPWCSELISEIVPDLFQINVGNTFATVYFTPIIDVFDYYISYSTNTNAEEHGVLPNLSDKGVQSFRINDLKPNTTYNFKVRGNKGCKPGNWSNILQIKTRKEKSQGERPCYEHGSNIPGKVICKL